MQFTNQLPLSAGKPFFAFYFELFSTIYFLFLHN